MGFTYYCSTVVFVLLILADAKPTVAARQQCNVCQSGSNFPDCMAKTVTCNSHHVCSILYKTDESLSSYIYMGCTSQCLPYPMYQTSSSRCKHGGGLTTSDACYLCCQNNSCYHQFKQLALPTTTAPTTTTQLPTIRCPKKCPSSDLNRCSSNTQICLGTQYCNIVYNADTDAIEGLCVARSRLSVCQFYNTDHHCPFSASAAHGFFTTHGGLHGYCYLGCCANSRCIHRILNSNTVTTRNPTIVKTHPTGRPTTTPTTTTTAATTTTTTAATSQPIIQPTITTTTVNMAAINSNTTLFNYSSLMTSCVDMLEGRTCAILRDTQDICTTPDAVALCAQTCNICKTVRALQCVDKNAGVECDTIASKPGFCQTKIAIFICPKACNLCDVMVKTVVNEVIAASPIPDFDQPLTTLPTLHCQELVQSQCDHVKALCKVTNLKDVCPKECHACA